MGHTPGPWKVNSEKLWMVIMSEKATGGMGFKYAAVGGAKQDELEANANLIAAAPELLETLEKAASWMRFWLDQQECDCPEIYHTCGRYDRERELEQMQAAIKKAKGA